MKIIVGDIYRYASAVFVLSLVSMHTLFADELLLRDGSRVHGEVVKKEGGTLEFKTSHSGVMNVNWSEVDELITESPMRLMLDDDRIISARRIKNAGDSLSVQGELPGSTRNLPQSALAFINPPLWKTGEGYQFTGGANYYYLKQRGNTDTDEVGLDANATWRFKADRVNAFAQLQKQKNDNEKSKDNWKAGASYHRFLNKKWYVGATLGLEHDDFADLNLRTRFGPITGYQWFESADMNLSTEVGLLYVDEDFNKDQDDDYLSMGWGVNFDKQLLDKFAQFYHRHTGIWSLEDTGDVILNTWTGLRFPMAYGLVASTELRYDYNSGAASGADDTDTTFGLKLGYAW